MDGWTCAWAHLNVYTHSNAKTFWSWYRHSSVLSSYSKISVQRMFLSSKLQMSDHRFFYGPFIPYKGWCHLKHQRKSIFLIYLQLRKLMRTTKEMRSTSSFFKVQPIFPPLNYICLYMYHNSTQTPYFDQSLGGRKSIIIFYPKWVNLKY